MTKRIATACLLAAGLILVGWGAAARAQEKDHVHEGHVIKVEVTTKKDK
jgi:hypothetical protein